MRRLRYVFPCDTNRQWTLDIDPALGGCVGYYARLPELLKISTILTVYLCKVPSNDGAVEECAGDNRPH